MDSSTALRLREPFSGSLHAKNEPSNAKTIGFAIALILGLGGLAVAGMGLGGYLQAGALSSLGQVNSMIMMAAGGGGGILFLVIGIVGFVKNCLKNVHPLNSDPIVNQQITTPTLDAQVIASLDTPDMLIYGADAYAIWNVEVLDQVPAAPKIRWDDKDPHFEEAFRENYVLLYIPEKIRVDDQEKDFTLKTFKEMRKESFKNFDESVEKNFGDSKATGWVLISKKMIPESRKKNYVNQQKLVEAKKGFYMPHVLEAVVLNLMLHAFTQERLYGKIPPTSTRCVESVPQMDWDAPMPIAVGSFGDEGLCVEAFLDGPFKFYGAACVMREFSGQ